MPLIVPGIRSAGCWLLVAIAPFCAWAQQVQPPAIYGALSEYEELVRLDTRASVTVKLVLVSPQATPKGVFLLFPGGDGRLVVEDGRIIRASFGRVIGPMLAAQGFAVVGIDAPSDQPSWGYRHPSFRVSEEHVQDVGKIVAFAIQRWNKPIFLLGHSNGTLSVAHVAATLGGNRFAAIVLAASVGRPFAAGFPTVSGTPLRNITAPALVVHHRDDRCAVTPFDEAARLPGLLGSSTRVALIEVRGGRDASRESNPCRGLWDAHNFYGKEPEVVAAISNWVLGGSAPERIDP